MARGYGIDFYAFEKYANNTKNHFILLSVNNCKYGTLPLKVNIVEYINDDGKYFPFSEYDEVRIAIAHFKHNKTVGDVS